MKILLVDDQQAQLVALEAVLSDIGDVVCATSGREALRRLLREEFAVILLDVNMPDMNGFETAALIRKKKSLEHTPIIFITASPDELQMTRGYSLGAVDYILTPVVPDILRSKVLVFVELYRNAAKIRQQAERLRKRAGQLAALNSHVLEVEERERRRLARVLHDHVQQLLAAARTRVQIAREGDDPSTLPEMLTEVDELIAQSISAARSLSVELHPPVLASSGLVPALQWLARHMHRSCRLTVELEADDETELTESHRVFLFDAVRELLLNIVKHSGVDEAKILLRRVRPDVLQLTVEDRGTGFDPEALDSEEAAFEHSGLRGIRERIEALDGEMSVESSYGAGARIELRVPTANSAALDDVASGDGDEEEVERRAPRAGTIRVLLSDDHEIVRKALRVLLQRQPDIEVVGEAADGHEAVALSEKLQPDVVVMDLSMPGLDGIEATRRVLAHSPGMRVVGLSMNESEHAENAMLQAGAVSYVPKGGPPEQLITAIRSCLDPRGSPGPFGQVPLSPRRQPDEH